MTQDSRIKVEQVSTEELVSIYTTADGRKFKDPYLAQKHQKELDAAERYALALAHKSTLRTYNHFYLCNNQKDVESLFYVRTAGEWTSGPDGYDYPMVVKVLAAYINRDNYHKTETVEFSLGELQNLQDLFAEGVER